VGYLLRAGTNGARTTAGSNEGCEAYDLARAFLLRAVCGALNGAVLSWWVPRRVMSVNAGTCCAVEEGPRKSGDMTYCLRLDAMEAYWQPQTLLEQF
jgi:hypothetical protein